ncbi:MAG: zinc ribbon domain-containing protein [Lachnospiraceae bacterium]|nr:zinc ribbon domain-containing protein [Lachnospiraceae bacterium]
MNCTKCGAPLESDAKFCNVCGSPVEMAVPATADPYVPGGQSGYASGGQGGYTPGSQGGYVPGTQSSYVPVTQSGYVPGTQGGYASGGQGGYVPGSQGGYTPGGSGGRGGYSSGGRGGAFVESSVVRKYFLSNRTWPAILILIGIPLICAMGIGLILILIGLFFLFKNDYTGEASVDQAWDNQVEIMTQRGMEKLNMIQEQVSLIDPVILTGLGAAPDSSFEAAKAESEAKKNKGLWSSIFRLFQRNSSDGTELDPVVALRIGSDDALRSMLMEVSLYVFTETQVLMYRGDVDISTGLVYQEFTGECFYKDIEGMRFEQSLYKVFNRRSKKYINKVTESFVLYLGGCSFSANVNTEVGKSVMDTQFTAMRNLIRDKKNA